VSTNSAGLAPYEQVAATIRQEIRARHLEVGAKLPSHRELADKYRVALGTAQKAVKLLETQGWLVARPSVGVFVTEPPNEAEAASLANLRDRLASLQADVASLSSRVDRIEGQPGLGGAAERLDGR